MDLSNYDFKLFEQKYFIRETLLDIYGHMNNASFLQLYEEARWDLVTERGYGLAVVNELNIGPVILSVKADFKKELKGRDEVTITTQVTKYKGKIGNIHQKMIKANGDVASEADFVFGLFDLKERKLIEPTKRWLKAFADEKS